MNRHILLVTITVLFTCGMVKAQTWPYNDPRTRCTSERAFATYNCTGFRIDCAVNGAVMGCLDTLRIITGTNRPQVRKDGPPWATLYRRTMEGLQPLDVRFELVEGKPWANMIIEGGLVNYVNSSTMGFVLRTRCAAFERDANDSTELRFTMYPVYKVRTEVRSEHDQSLIDNVTIALPYGDEEIRDMKRAFRAEAPAHEGDWSFVKWTSTYPHIIDDTTSPSLDATSKCWPLVDTVVLTAWYERRTLSFGQGSTVSIMPRIQWDPVNDMLRVQGDIEALHIYDMSGRLYREIDQVINSGVNVQLPRGPWIVRTTQSGGQEQYTTVLVY